MAFPVDCTLGVDCYIEDYADIDPGPGAQDYTCGRKTRPDHNGTDIALPSLGAMEAGVIVRAAASGLVEAVRDTMPDTLFQEGTDLQGQECGNAVRINHGNGYLTIYCHLARGSVTVAPQQLVDAGDPIGRIGLSGWTNYPHLHLTVLRESETGSAVVDPFAANAEGTCQPNGDSLWLDTPPYIETALADAGVADRVPEFDEVQTGAARMATIATGDAMVLYGYAQLTQPGDQMRFRMTGPSGPVFAHETSLDVENQHLFRAFGRRAPEGGWASGDYAGVVTLMRGDTLIAARQTSITVE